MPTRANGQPALAFYRIEAKSGAYLALALDVLTIRDGRIADVTAFRSPSLFRYFDLPATVEPAGADGRRQPRTETRSGL